MTERQKRPMFFADAVPEDGHPASCLESLWSTESIEPRASSLEPQAPGLESGPWS